MANESFKKLLTIQQKLNVPKGKKNDYGAYKYRNLEDILAGAKPLLEAINAVLILEDSIQKLDQDYLLTATATLYDADTRDEIVKVSFPVVADIHKKGMCTEQAIGAASSYARKYALSGLFAISGEEDADDMGDYRTPNKAVSKDSAAPEKSRKDILWEKYSKAPAYDPYKKLLLKLTGDEISPDDFTQFGWHVPFDKTDKRCIEEALKNYDDYCKQFKDKMAAAEEEIPF